MLTGHAVCREDVAHIRSIGLWPIGHNGVVQIGDIAKTDASPQKGTDGFLVDRVERSGRGAPAPPRVLA
ncbi:MAG: hypothetical protein QGH25_12070, partial [Candidatus Latescibacteria bacterium]|nr:hypothetical protein [Candidatus Latescibacterota bacterium]